MRSFAVATCSLSELSSEEEAESDEDEEETFLLFRFLLRFRAGFVAGVGAMVKTKYGKRVKKWMSDAGGEYISAAFKTMLKDEGIEILQSSPHTPQENGRAE